MDIHLTEHTSIDRRVRNRKNSLQDFLVGRYYHLNEERKIRNRFTSNGIEMKAE